MNKKIILSIMLIVAMVIASSAVLAVKNINITDSQVTVSGVSGNKVGSVNVKNTGNETVNVTFESTVLVGDSIQNPSITKITNLVPGNTQASTFTVNLDEKAGNYTGVITAHVEGSSESDSVLLQVIVQDNGLGLSVTPSIVSSTQTDTVVSQVMNVQNLANKDMDATIVRSGYDGLTFTLDKEGSYTFPALSTTQVTATIVIPAGIQSNVYNGRVDFTAGSTYSTILQTIVQPTYKVSAPDVKITTDPGSSSSATLLVSNTGNINLTGLAILNIPILYDNDGDSINLTVSPNSSISVAVGTTKTLTISASTSPKMDSGSYAGTLTISGGGISKQFNVVVEVRDVLQIIDISTNDDEFNPGEKISLDVEVENIADKIDLEDVEIKVYFLSGGNRLEDDDGDDIEEISERFNLDAGDTETVSFDFIMPYGVEDGDEITVYVEAKGKNADDSTEKYTVVDDSNTIFAAKEEHKLELYDIRLDSSALSCSRSTYIRVGVRDIGNNNEDDVELAVTNAELDISKHEVFDMSNDPDDDNFEVERSFLLDLEDAPTGSYDLDVVVFYDDDNEKEESSIALAVGPCSGSSTSTTGTTSTYVPPSVPTGSTGNVEFTYSGVPSSGASTVSATSVAPRISSAKPKTSWTDSIAFLIIVGIANVLLVIVIILAVVSLVRK